VTAVRVSPIRLKPVIVAEPLSAARFTVKVTVKVLEVTPETALETVTVAV
jgi:hypothetical protein